MSDLVEIHVKVTRFQKEWLKVKAASIGVSVTSIAKIIIADAMAKDTK